MAYLIEYEKHRLPFEKWPEFHPFNNLNFPVQAIFYRKFVFNFKTRKLELILYETLIEPGSSRHDCKPEDIKIAHIDLFYNYIYKMCNKCRKIEKEKLIRHSIG